MYFQIYQVGGGLLNYQWRWRLKSANHHVIASGESYHNKQDCLNAIGLIMGTSSTTPVYEA